MPVAVHIRRCPLLVDSQSALRRPGEVDSSLLVAGTSIPGVGAGTPDWMEDPRTRESSVQRAGNLNRVLVVGSHQ